MFSNVVLLCSFDMSIGIHHATTQMVSVSYNYTLIMTLSDRIFFVKFQYIITTFTSNIN